MGDSNGLGVSKVYRMANYDRVEHMKTIHIKRKEHTHQKVDQAIKRLVRANGNINFNSVASEAGVAKATLYNHSDIRERIEDLRLQQVKSPTQKQIRREMNDSNKDAIIASLKRRIKRVEEENKDLRQQLKVAYSEIYRNN